MITVVDLTTYSGEDWDFYLKDILMYDIFEKVCKEYRGEKLTGIIRYIVMCYSLDSNKISLNGDWLSTKKKVFNLNNLSADLFDEIVMLKSDSVRNSIILWLNYQNESSFDSWAMLNDLIIEIRMAANSNLRKGITKDNIDGVPDYDAKIKCAESVLDLIIKKDEFEQRFIQNNEKLRVAYTEISASSSKKEATSFGIETFLKQMKK